MDQEIDISSFNDWLEHPITKELMNLCRYNLEIIQDSLTNGELIMAPNEIKNLARCLGMKEILERIRDLQLSDLIVQEIDTNDDESKT